MNLYSRLIAAAAATVGLTAAAAVGSAAVDGGSRVRPRVEAVSVQRSAPVQAAVPAAPAPRVAPKPAVVKPVPAKPAVRRSVPTRAPVPARVAKKPSATTTTRVTAASTVSSYTRGCDGTSGWQKRRGAYALRRITYNWRKTGYTIHFMAARRGITGMTYPASKRIEVYVRSCSKMTNAYLAETIAHEIGHSVDFTLGTNAWQRKWQLARHISLSIPWYGAPYATDFATPAGDFAETFGAWQVPDGPNDSKWGRPSATQLKLLIPLLNL